MSNKRRMNVDMSRRAEESAAFALSILALVAILPTTTTIAECATLEAPVMRLINDEALLLEEPKPTASAGDVGRHLDDDFQPHYDMYRSSELRRLSYETIHRILRDENEPIHRRGDADTDTRFYQKRSYTPSHELFRRAAERSVEKLPFNQEPLQLLNLTHSNLNKLPATATDYEQVRVLDVSANALRNLSFKLFPQLQWADLSQNAFAELPLVENSTLSFINLNANRISNGTAPRNCSRLQQLHLSGNQVKHLAALNLSALVSLDTLDLSCNRIEEAEAPFFPQRMDNLKYLNLARNQLGAVYRETFYNLLSLNTLILSHNNITDVDYESFLALPSLQYLDLSNNQLRGESVRALQGIPDLVGLSIAYNPQLGDFMQEFVASWSLKELDASGTGLCQIPAALAQSVRTLKLSDNWLTIINCGDLDSYPLLQYLDLSRSHIEDIEEDALGRLEILEVLLLAGNHLHKVPVSLPTSLRHLFLQHNQIMDIQGQTLQGLSNLQTLDLSHNKLLYLPALPLPKLLTLNLQSSELCGLNQAIVHTLPRLREMLLDDNPIKCSDLLGIAEWATSCRMADHAAPADRQDQKNPERPESEASQLESTKNDLKQRFLQMHNFFRKFRSDCKGSGEERGEEPRPTCAIQPAEVDIKSTAAEAEVITLNSPTKLQTMPSSNSTKAFDNQLNPQPAASRSNEVNAAAATEADTVIPTRKTLSSSSNVATTSKTLLKSNAAAKPTATAAITTASPSAVANLEADPTSMNTTDAEDANQEHEPDTNLINSEDAETPDAAIAAMNPTQQQQGAEATLTLSQRKVLSRTEDGESADIPPTAGNREATSMTIYTRLPQTIATAIKPASNYAETTTLLSRQGLKTSAAALLPDVTTSDSDGSKFHKMEQRQKFNGASGQPHLGAEPTTVLADELELGSNKHTASSNSSHKHAPIQLHVKDRHLIGTPLLMHMGHNILAESEQLTLPTESPSTAPTTGTALKAQPKEAAKKASATTGNGSRTADKLEVGQSLDEAEDPQFVAATTSRATEKDKLQASEAIKQKTNEQSVDRVANLNSPNDKHSREDKTVNTPLQYNSAEEDVSAGKRLHEIVIKKKLPLTLKKSASTKKAATQSLRPPHHLQTLNTPRENEAVATHGALADRPLVNPLKGEFNEEKPHEKRLLSHKHRTTVNQPVEKPRLTALDLPQLGSILQQSSETDIAHLAGISKSEQWLDVRKHKTASTHPGLVMLVSSVAFIVLLVGAVQVYRCDKHWRRQRTGQRPHQRPLNEDSSGNSFLTYHNRHSLENPAPQKWPSYRSPLHNLHVRELQKTSAVELKQNYAAPGTSNNSSCTTSYGSRSNNSSSNAMAQDEAFYIEVTPNPSQPTSNAYSDLLPMELLGFSASRRSTADLCNSDHHALYSSEDTSPTQTAPTADEHEAAAAENANGASTWSDKRLPLVRLTPTTRKFDLW